MPPTATERQLAAEIHDLRSGFHDFRAEVAEKLGAINANIEGLRTRTDAGLATAQEFRVEIAEKLGAINANLEGFRGRTETSLAVARWMASALVPIVVALMGWGFMQAQRAAHIEDSIAELRGHARDQDSRIARLIEFHGPGNTTPRVQPKHPQ